MKDQILREITELEQGKDSLANLQLGSKKKENEMKRGHHHLNRQS